MFTVAALYRFTPFPDAPALIAPLQAVCEAHGICGILLVAPEGINGTIGGSAEGIGAVLAHIRALPGCADLEPKFSTASERPFNKMRVRLKREIVTMKQPHVDPLAGTGTYVAAKDWNALISAPDVAVIDTRNDYEVAIGTFAGAQDPETASFSEFPDWWRANADRFEGKRIAMFCTGGIRCEKATNWMLGEGVEDVYHLDGGILKYLEEVPEAESLWQGECFVFDKRVAVGHGLEEGTHTLCYACRRPVSPEGLAHPDYEPGVQCAACVDEYSEADRARFRTRHLQRNR